MRKFLLRYVTTGFFFVISISFLGAMATFVKSRKKWFPTCLCKICHGPDSDTSAQQTHTYTRTTLLDYFYKKFFFRKCIKYTFSKIFII